MLVNATWSLMGTFLRYTCKELSWRLVLFWGRICFSGKDHFAGEQHSGQKKPYHGLLSVHPTLFWFALPTFETRQLDWAPDWALAKPVWHEECHCHWEWQGNSMLSQAATWILLSPASKVELWDQLSPADLSAFIATLKKKWKDH